VWAGMKDIKSCFKREIWIKRVRDGGWPQEVVVGGAGREKLRTLNTGGRSALSIGGSESSRATPVPLCNSQTNCLIHSSLYSGPPADDAAVAVGRPQNPMELK
jgi:hypothetical protein